MSWKNKHGHRFLCSIVSIGKGKSSLSDRFHQLLTKRTNLHSMHNYRLYKIKGFFNNKKKHSEHQSDKYS